MSLDRARQSISEQYRKTRRARLDKLERELAEMARKWSVMNHSLHELRRELRQEEETTIALPILPPK